MLITYFRSSSYNTWDFCPHQYYLEYVLGLPALSNKKAEKGTITHKILETIALKTKRGKPPDTKQINSIATRVFNKYTQQLTHHAWDQQDQKDCREWTWKALRFNDGQFDPRKRSIVDAEPFFDLIIEDSWAKYKYKTKGGLLEGQLGLKGTIDLVTDIGDDTYEIIDWKTGKMWDWAKDKEKTFDDLLTDPQLMLYYYAAQQLYPGKNVIITIFYINDGGPFTLPFEPSSLKAIEKRLHKRYKIIISNNLPKLKKTWKCHALCHYGKNNWNDTDKTQCEFIHQQLKRKGMKYVTDNFTQKGHSVGEYRAPGEV